jgi:hypothetical protein
MTNKAVILAAAIATATTPALAQYNLRPAPPPQQMTPLAPITPRYYGESAQDYSARDAQVQSEYREQLLQQRLQELENRQYQRRW